MAAPDGPKSQFGAHIVTRPNPDIVGANKDQLSTSSAQLLQHASKAWTTLRQGPFSRSNKARGPESRKVLLQSFSDIDEKDGSLVSYNNGFVDGIIRAFQQDLHLVLRPDDVWLAIMVQFSYYVNGHAEEMRRFFVNHKGKKQLIVDTGASSPLSVDFSEIAQAFKDLIQANVVDAELTSWILPNFSTTTSEDITTTTLVMMTTTKAYFEYIIRGGCGFPSVTLLGVRADWVKLLEKVAKVATYGGDLAVWSRLLTKVVEKMIKTFDQPDLQTTKDFWMRAVHHAGAEGSGSIETLSGWITAFCRWDEEGRLIKQVDEAGKTWDGKYVDRKRFVIDDVPFPIIRAEDVPRAATEVPVMVLDHAADICYHTTAIAGLIGVKPTASEEGGPHDTFRPRSGYWMLIDKIEPISAGFELRDGYDLKRI